MIKEYQFTIEDNEFNPGTKYDYTGHFETTFDAAKFIRENKAEGNKLHINSITFITLECMDIARWERL